MEITATSFWKVILDKPENVLSNRRLNTVTDMFAFAYDFALLVKEQDFETFDEANDFVVDCLNEYTKNHTDRYKITVYRVVRKKLGEKANELFMVPVAKYERVEQTSALGRTEYRTE